MGRSIFYDDLNKEEKQLVDRSIKYFSNVGQNITPSFIEDLNHMRTSYEEKYSKMKEEMKKLFSENDQTTKQESSTIEPLDKTKSTKLL